MSRDPVMIDRGATVSEAARQVMGTRYVFYPVVRDGSLEGVVSRMSIDEAARDGRGEAFVETIMQEPQLVAGADERVLDVVQQMQVRGVDRCPVVEGVSRRVVGFLSPSDILRARMGSGQAQADGEFELFE